MKTLSFLAAALAFASPAVLADDWTVVRLRGGVFALSGSDWQQLERGSIVSDDRVIRSGTNSRATLVRNRETLEIAPETTVQISDGQGFTTIYNHLGSVGVDADAREFQHLAVQTPHLVAVIKGTAFTVAAGAKRSTVAVSEGFVAVEDQQFGGEIYLSAGQEVTSDPGKPLEPIDVVNSSTSQEYAPTHAHPDVPRKPMGPPERGHGGAPERTEPDRSDPPGQTGWGPIAPESGQGSGNSDGHPGQENADAVHEDVGASAPPSEAGSQRP